MTKLYKVCLALFISLISVQANAQYYYLPSINAATNPGGLNSDDEYPFGGGLPAGWTIVVGPSATPSWSSAQTLPVNFNFSFNGSPVTQYKVSTSGVVTFDIATALAAPSYTKAALPDVSIPDNSVCIWGLAGMGTNDNVVTKTFGTSPNRQVWIMFNSYGYGTVASNGTNYTYWSIVLEETSNKIYIVDQRTGGYAGTKKVSAGIQINSTTAYAVATSPNLTALAGTSQTPSDNSYYEFIQGTQPAVQTQLKSVAVSNSYVVVPGSTTISGTIKNLGSSTLTSADVTYRVNGTDYTTTLSSLSVPSMGTYNFTHPTTLNVANANEYAIQVWVTTAGDADHTDDTLNTKVSGLTFLPTKRVLMEEGTGTWCGWCPRGAVYTEQFDTVYAGTAIVVAVHNADPMTDAVYDAGMGSMISGYPSGLVDRTDIDVDPMDFGTSYLNRINDVPPADISVDAFYSTSSGIADIIVTAHVAGELNGDYRLNAVLVEDDVTGTGSTWSQTNYYSSSSQNLPLVGAGHDWQNSPNPVPYSQMHYNFVARAILGGFEGEIGSLPSTMNANNSYSYTFSYAVPSTYEIGQMRVIGMLQDFNTGRVLNVNRGSYGITTAIKTVESADFAMAMYPNPATDVANLMLNLVKGGEFTIDVFNVIGQSVYTQKTTATAGKNIFSLPVNRFEDGVYMVRVTMNGSQLTQRLIVK